MTSLDELAAPHLARLLDDLRARGAGDRVVEAMAATPRHRFVDHFWTEEGEWRLHADVHADQRRDHLERALQLVYSTERAMGLEPPRDRGPTRTTASAPAIVAAMLRLLELQGGERVLEIGAGSGWNASLIAHLAGDAGAVTTIDLDADLVERAAARLRGHGLGNVECRAGDGFAGAADRAPFDRIVATAGCHDLSPAWVEQLASGGFALIPLHHAGIHPLVRVERGDGDTPVGRIVGRSAFVHMRGESAWRGPWLAPGRTGPRDDVRKGAIPADVAEAVDGRTWDLSFVLSLTDRRAAHLMTLNDGEGSTAIMSAATAELMWSGPEGEALADALLAHARAWIDAGRPSTADFTITFEPVASAPVAGGGRDPQANTWVIERPWYREVVARVDG
ncbi:MAG TPA: protein-L-isoaspartate O-methyltransferase [Acidimicrobiales bacterium]